MSVTAQHDVRAGNDVEVLGAELDVRGLDGQRAALRHRVARVDDEVHQDLAKLLRIGAECAESCRELQRQLQPDLGAQQPAEQILHVGDDRR